MQPHIFLLQLVIILISARILGELAARFNIPSVIGEIVAGILIGPSIFGWITLSAPVNLLAQIGIILLLFEVGVETNLSKLTSSSAKAFIVAISGVVLPFGGGLYVCYQWFDLSLLASLFIASTLTATSIGITLRVLQDLKRQSSQEAQVIIGAAVLDDIIGIVLLSILYEFSVSGEVNLFNASKVLLFIIFFFLTAPFAAKLLSHTIKRWEEKSDIPGLLPTAIVSLILFFAFISHKLGAPELLGGFAAGLALSRQFFFPFAAFLGKSEQFSKKVEQQMKPIIHLFSPIFFVAIGLSLDFKTVNFSSSYIWTLTLAIFVVAVLGKMLSGLILIKDSMLSRCIIGVSMVPRGEVGLIFANVALTAKVIDESTYTSLILVIALTTLLAPFSLRYLFNRNGRANKKPLQTR